MARTKKYTHKVMFTPHPFSGGKPRWVRCYILTRHIAAKNLKFDKVTGRMCATRLRGPSIDIATLTKLEHQVIEVSQDPEAMPPKERILCAAVWVDDGIARPGQPAETGVVVCGYRHDHCIQLIRMMGEELTSRMTSEGQGFLTDRRRFVDREEARIIAEEAGQIVRESAGSRHLLFSENLY